MHVIHRRGWELPEHVATPEGLFFDRRQFIAGAAAQVKPLSLELGGHSPVLVFDDADLAKAIEGTMIAKYRNTGQSCIAANRIYVQRGIAARFIPAFVERVKALKVGNSLEPSVEIGQLINPGAVDLALKHIADAQAKSAQLLCGGKRHGDAGSAFLEPTVLTGVPMKTLDRAWTGHAIRQREQLFLVARFSREVRDYLFEDQAGTISRFRICSGCATMNQIA